MNNSSFNVYDVNKSTPISNQLARDKRLSWKSRGLYCYLASMASDGHNPVLSRKDIIDSSLEGRHALINTAKELEHYGYLTVKRVMNEYGRFSGEYEWQLHDTPDQVPDITRFDRYIDKLNK